MAEAPNAIDVHVGRRVRHGRRMRGMMQSELADRIGLTYQQVHKYERGANRIGASMLVAIARALDLPIGFFFRGLVEVVIGPWGVEDEIAQRLAEHIMEEPDGLAFLTAFPKIRNEAVRRAIIDLVLSLAANDDTRDPAPPDP
jgi:transcriptional regulator with XRE-family HTH domain